MESSAPRLSAAFMANELGNRLAGEAGFPSPKGGDIRGRYWRPAEVRAWARRWAKNARGGS